MAYSGVNTLTQNLLIPYLINFYIISVINFINVIDCNVYIIYSYFNNTNINKESINEYQKFNCDINSINMIFIIFIGYLYLNFYNKIPKYKQFYENIYYYYYYRNLI